MSNLNMSRLPWEPMAPSGLITEGFAREVFPGACAEPDDEAGAIATAMKVFEDGLARLLKAGPTADPTPAALEDVTGLLTAIAEQTSLMALRAVTKAARDGASGRGYTVAAADMRDLAGQMSRATETLVSQVGVIQAAAERRAKSSAA